MIIRELFAEDMHEAMDLDWTVFSEFEAPDYPDEGVETFRAFITTESVTKMLEDGVLRFWGGFDRRKLVGVIACRIPDHISLFFVRKENHRQGIGRALFRVLEENCMRSGAKVITVYSSPYAAEVYRRLGFVDTGPETMENGLRYVPMKYEIISM